MKITLIYPGIAGLGFNSLGKGDMNHNWINLGLAYIGAYVKRSGHIVDLIDLRGLSGWEEVQDELKTRASEVVGVYFSTVNFDNAIRCCKIAKEQKMTVVSGGPHASIDPQGLIETGAVDYVITGEGEISFCELLNDLQAGRHPEKIIAGKVIENLDELPFPDRELYDLNRVLNPRRNFPFLDNGLIMLTSRGCPYNCRFCQPLGRRMFGAGARFRSVANVVEEFKFLVNKHKVKYLSFQDDTFTLRKDWVLELCARIKAEKLQVQWSAQSRVNTFDEELAQAMTSAGCVCLFFGFESGSQRMLDFLSKGINADDALKVARLCKKYGIVILADYMSGIPTETEEDLRATLEQIRLVRPELLSVTYFTPVPGCELYEYCKSNNLIKIKTFEDFERSPTSEKIYGVDYALVKRYRARMYRYVPKWFSEGFFARLAIKRWAYLIRRGMLKEFVTEFLGCSSPFPFGIRTALRKMLGRTKRQ
ncbi:MAG: B12-binding domain-containing radical SAM protein [Candidatus Omnitrophota bacterium]